MSDTTIYDTTVQTDGTLALAHEQILRLRINGVFVNVTGDLNNLLDTPNPVSVTRENYGLKASNGSEVIAYSHVVTAMIEAVRTSTGALAQAWLVELLNRGRLKGAGNRIEVQVFDAKDETVPAWQGSCSVNIVRSTTGYADKQVYSLTLTSNGPVTDIVSPIAGTGAPVLESALPTGKGASGNVVVRGYLLGGVTAATVGGTAVTSITPVDSNTVVLELPAGAAGSAPIIITTAKGASTALPYTRVV